MSIFIRFPDSGKKGNKENLISEIGIALIIAVLVIMWILLVPQKFDSAATVINAMAMDLNYVKMSYSELDNKLIVTRDDSKKTEFKLTEGGFEYLQSRLIEENKDWGGWTFKHKEMPAGEGDEKYKVYRGTRELKQ